MQLLSFQCIQHRALNPDDPSLPDLEPVIARWSCSAIHSNNSINSWRNHVFTHGNSNINFRFLNITPLNPNNQDFVVPGLGATCKMSSHEQHYQFCKTKIVPWYENVLTWGSSILYSYLEPSAEFKARCAPQCAKVKVRNQQQVYRFDWLTIIFLQDRSIDFRTVKMRDCLPLYW